MTTMTSVTLANLAFLGILPVGLIVGAIVSAMISDESGTARSVCLAIGILGWWIWATTVLFHLLLM